jgi:hypothetical protein
MKLINNILYVEWSDLQGWGVSEATIKSACRDYRGGVLKSWANIPDPSDRRKCLVEYSTIPAQTYKKYSLPSEAELRRQCAAAAEAQVSQAVARLLPTCSRADMEVLQGWRIEKQEVDPMSGAMRTHWAEGLPEARIAEYAQACAWLGLMSSDKVLDKRFWQSLGTNGKMETLQKLQKLAQEQGVKLPSAYFRLLEKIEEYRVNGAVAVINKRFGNQNANKVSGLALELLIDLHSDPRKFDTRTIAQSYADKAAQSGGKLPILSESCIRYNLMRPEVSEQWYGERHGSKAYNNRYGHELKTRKASFRDALWVIDGTKVNLMYREENGQKAAKLNMVVVLDAYSLAFIGWTIVEQENAQAIGAAMRMALQKTKGYAPHQVLYDNDTANKSFFKVWLNGSFPAQPYNAKSKPIERAFGGYQDRVLRVLENFTGMNMTARSERGRANDEFVKDHVILPTKAEAIKQAIRSLHAYNQLVNPTTGKSPWQLYSESEHTVPLPYQLTERDYVTLFWQWRQHPVSYTNAGITLANGREKRQFEVYAQVSGSVAIPNEAFLRAHVGRQFWVKEAPADMATGRVALYVGDDRETSQFVAYADTKVAVARAIIDAVPGERITIDASLNARKKAINENRASSKARTAALIDALGDGIEDPLLANTKQAYHAAESMMIAEKMGARQQMIERELEADEEADLVPVQVEPSKTSYRLTTAAERAEEAYRAAMGL